MPRIPPKVLDCVCYLYDSEDDARAGKNFGGTGFLVTVPSPSWPLRAEYAYVVTSWHVACRGASVIRLNTLDGGTGTLPYGPEMWEFDPDRGSDIAVAPLPIRHDFHRYAFVPSTMFLEKEDIKEERIGPGEDVFMVGRFVDHDGGHVNLPAVRFGNISVMPTPIEQESGRMVDSFCLDLHSRSGYSGSPVFLYRTPGYDLELPLEREDGSQKFLVSGVNYFALLGIHFSQFPELWELRDGAPKRSEASREPLITEGKYVRGLSGMTCVLPAWEILRVLSLPKLVRQRADADKQIERQMRHDRPRPEPESAERPVETGDDDDRYPPEEAARRRDETLRRMAAMPPKRQKEMKLGKPRGRRS